MREKIKSAARAEIARRSDLLKILDKIDAGVATRALAVLDTPSDAAEWLFCPNWSVSSGRAPVELVQTPKGKEAVLRLLGAIEHGVFV